MKLLPALTIIVLVATLIGLLQHRELQNLRQRSGDLLAVTKDPLASADVGLPNGTRRAAKTAATPDGSMETPPALDNSKLPVDFAADDLIRRAEELIRSGSMLKAATELIPAFKNASPEMLKAVLARLDTADIPAEARGMAYSTMLSKLVKTEPEASMDQALAAAASMGEPFGSGLFQKGLRELGCQRPHGRRCVV